MQILHKYQLLWFLLYEIKELLKIGIHVLLSYASAICSFAQIKAHEV